ncbi:MAG: hypothetical protein FJ149_05175 [Euryarchaeota archaeon]|nr:hypothetical protein [Euryarchaeota archaeon]
MMKQKDQRDTVLQWKNLKMVPHVGFVITFAGSVLAYVGARLVNLDNIRLENWRKYQSILAQVHADGKVSTDEAAILARERQLLRISKEDHAYIIKRTVADPATQQRLLAMHETPIDVEGVLRAREFDAYRRALVQAHADGQITQDESDLLRAQREGLGITDADHEAMMRELIGSGEIRLSGPAPGPRAQPEPKAPAPPAPMTRGPSAPKSQTPPLPPPIPPPEKPTAPPPPAGGPVSLLSGSHVGPSAPPGSPPEKAAAEPLKRVKCSKCGETIPVHIIERPVELTCPKCGFKGTLWK